MFVPIETKTNKNIKNIKYEFVTLALDYISFKFLTNR